MTPLSPKKRARAPKRPPPTYQVVLVQPQATDPKAAAALLAWLAARAR